jgi:hypothetical protein
MRILVAPLVAAALLASAGASLGAGTPSLTLSVSSFRVLYGHTVALDGRISNARAGTRVLVYAQAYGGHWRRIATVTTRAGGRFGIAASPSIGTDYQARAAGTHWSAPVAVGVTPLVRVHELRGGAVQAQVSAGRSFAGRFVKLQRSTAGGWATIAQRRLGRHSLAVFDPLPTTAAIRVALSVNEAGAGYLGSLSHPLLYRLHSISLGVSTYRVPFGRRVVLSGRLGSGQAGQVVTLRAWPYGAAAPHRAAQVRTGAGGRWSFRARPSIQTIYSASWGSVSSRRITVGVEPRIDVRQLANGSIWTQVFAVRGLRGRTVQLQRELPGGVWQTVARRALNRHSAAVFATRLPATRVRVAVSVNQAGAGLLGAFSAALAYHGT